jgi:hypothetical protein
VARLLEFPAEGGGVVIAVREPQDAVAPVGVGDKARQRMDESLDNVLSMVNSVARSFHESLKGTPVESGQIQFGLQFTTSGSVYILEAGAGASLTVTLTIKPLA